MLNFASKILGNNLSKKFFTLFAVLAMASSLSAQVNVAPLATASAAPACNTGPCSTLNDLNFGTCGTQQMWITSAASNPGSSVNVTFTWTSTQVVNKMTIHAAQNNTRFLTGGTIQVWNGTTWVNHQTFTQAVGVCNYDINFNPAATTAIRIVDITVGGSQTSNVNFREIEIWQGSISNNDVGITSIDSINSICTTSALPIYATITNFGKNQITSANVLWSVNGAIQSTIPFTGTLDTAGGAGSNRAAIALGSYAFSTTTPAVVRAWTSQPNGTADTIKVNDTSMVSKMVGMISGNYTIGGTSPDFANFTSAINALYMRGICGPVTFNVANGTYTEQLTMNGQVPGSSDINTITFKGASKAGAILNYYSTNTNARHTLLLTGGVKFVTFRDMTIQGNGLTTSDFAYTLIINGTTTRNIRIANCNVLIVGSNSLYATTNYIPIVLGGTSASYSAGGRLDSIEVDTCFISRGYFGIVHYNANYSQNMRFRGNTFSEQYYYGLFLNVYDNLTIENNYFNLQTATTGITPIYVVTAQAGVGRHHRIVGNIIPTMGNYAMYLSSVTNQTGAKGLLANNAVGGNALTGTGYGLYMASCTNFMMYHNSVNMATAGATSTAYAGIYMSGGSGNSIFNNNLARTVSGLGVPLYLSSSTVADSMDYNNFYKVDTVTAFIYVGGNLLPYNFRGASGFNTNSMFNQPGFISTTNLNTNFTCNNGTALTQALTDILGVARPANPDVGAYEGVSVGNNLGIEKIYAPTSSFTPGYTDVWALVRNYGTNSVSSYNVGYSLNDGPAVLQPITTSIASCDTASVYFTGSNQVLLGANNKLEVFTASPNSGIDSFPLNDTLIGNYYAPLNGSYTIGGATANFPSFTAAVNALKGTGISGPVTFNVNPGTFNESIILNGIIPGLSDTTRVEFIGADKNTVIMSANKGSGFIVAIDNNRYITFRNITMRNLSPSGGGFAVIGNNTNNAGTGCGIINCIIDMPNYTTGTAYPIIVTGTASGFGVGANRADSITIDSNIVNGGYYGITCYGATNPSYNRFIRIRNNTLTNIYYLGTYTAYNYNAIEFTNNSFSMNTIYGYYGIYFYANTNSNTTVGHKIANNTVIGHGGYGAYIYNPSANSSTAAINEIYNNMITSGSTYNSVYGVYLYDNAASRTNFYHNTLVNRYPNTQATYGVLYYAGSSNVMIKNNVFANLAGAGLPLYLGTSPATGNVNYNVYFNSSNANLVYRNGVYFNASNFNTAASGGDTSYNTNPGAVSPTNSHTTNACLPRGFDLTAFYPTDIDGQLRGVPPMIGADEIVGISNDLEIVSLLNPSSPVTIGAQDVRILVKNRGTNTVSSFNIAYRQNGGTPVIMAYSGSGLVSCDTVTMVFTGTQQITIGTGANVIKAYTYAPNASADADPSNDTINVTVATPLSGDYIVGAAPSDFANLTDALNAAGSRGLAGKTTFKIKTGVYNGTYTIVNVPGASATNTLNITSLAGHRDSVRLEYAVTPTNLQVFKIAANFVNFNKVTIRQTNGVLTNTNYIILYSAASSFDTINDCVIWGPMYGTDGTSTSNYSLYNNANSTDGLVYTNNHFKGSFFGVYFFGNSATYSIKNTLFQNNFFDSVTYGAVYYMYYTAGTKFLNNTFHHRTVGGTYTTGYQYFYYNDSAYTFRNNKITCFGGKGLYFYNYYSRNAVANPATVINNEVNAGPGQLYWAIGGSITNNYNFMNNSVYSGTNYTYLNATGNTNLRILNNTFTSATTYSFYWSTAPSSVANVFTNNNLYFSSSSTTPIYAGAARTLTALKLAYPLFDRHSVSYRAPYTSALSLIPNPNDTAVWLINGRANHEVLVPTDRTGLARPATVSDGAPDIGAYEVTPSATTLAPLATAVPAIPVAGATQHFILAQDSVAKITWDASSNIPTTSSLRYYTGEGPNVQGANGVAIKAAYNFQLSGTGLLYNMDLHYKPAMMGAVSSQGNLRTSNYYNSSWATQTASTVDSARLMVSASGMADSSAVWTLTDITNPLTTFLNVTAQPQSQTKCVGDSVIFTTAATGTGLSYQWQVNSGSGFTNITGATSASVTITGLTAAFNSNKYRCNITNSLGTATTNEATLTMGVTTAITTQPVSGAGCQGDNVVYVVGATGTNLTYQWEENSGSGFGTIAGATSATYVKTNIQAAMSGYLYRAVVTGTCGTLTSSSASLTVSGPITITAQPAPTVINTCAGSTVGLTLTATGGTTFQWQIDVGGGYFAIPGATTSTLSITNVPASYNGGSIRCVITNPCNVSFSAIVPITVQTPGLWSGSISSAWATAGNWGCSNVPTSATDVVIPSTAINMPTTATAINMKGITIQTGATLTLSTAAASMNVYGDFNNLGTISGSTAWINFMGTTQQSVDGNGVTYNKMSVNNANGIKLTDMLTIADTLQLVNGKVQLDGNDLTLGNSGRITGASATNYIVTNGAGDLGISNIGTGGRTGAVVFPVGTLSNYNPVTITNAGTADLYSARVIVGAYPAFSGNTPSGSAITTNAVDATWILEEMLAGGSNLSVTYQWNGSQELSGFTRTSSYVARYLANGWNNYAAGAAAGTNPYTRSATGITALVPMGIGSNGTLPVSWLSFNAKASAKDAVLDWATGSEINNKGFEVERSFNGQEFEVIGFVKGMGNSASVQTYSFVDSRVLELNSNGDVYYRLKQIDFDGNAEYSKVVMLTAQDNDDITLYPNPFNNEAGIFVSAVQDTKVSIEVKDLMGRTIFTTDKEVIKGVQYINIENLAVLANGMYLVQVNMNGEMKTFKVQKTN